MLRFRCPKCREIVDVDDAQVEAGVASCDACGQKVRLPAGTRPSGSPAPPRPRVTSPLAAGIRAADMPAPRLTVADLDDLEEVLPVDDGEPDPPPRRLPQPGVVDETGDNYRDFGRSREKPLKKRRRRQRRDTPTPSLFFEWLTPFVITLLILGLLSAMFGGMGLLVQGPEKILLVLGFVIIIVGGLWFTFVAIQDGEYLFCALIPGYALLYALRNTDTAGKPLLFQFVGCGMAIMALVIGAVPGRGALRLPGPPAPPPGPVIGPNPPFFPVPPGPMPPGPEPVGPGGFPPGPDPVDFPPGPMPGPGPGPRPPGPVGPEPQPGPRPPAPNEGKPFGMRGDPPAATEVAGLLGYWSFDEGKGNRAADGSNKGNDGTVRGSWVRGVRGHALWCKEKGDSFDYGDSPQFNFKARAAFTFAGWLQTRERSGVIVAQRNSKDGSPVIDISVKDGKLSFLVRQDGNEFGFPAEVNGGAIDDGEWHHFAAMRSTSGAITLYLDGENQGSASSPQSGGAITTDWRAVGVEKYWVNVRSAGQPYFNGCVDEFCIFNRALTRQDVRKLAGR